jgi:hypothetical protein
MNSCADASQDFAADHARRREELLDDEAFILRMPDSESEFRLTASDPCPQSQR